MNNTPSGFFAACAAAFAAYSKARHPDPAGSDASWPSLPFVSPPEAPAVPLAPSSSAAPDPMPATAPAVNAPGQISPVRLAASLAHEFNNYLTVIDGYSQMLLADPPEDEGTLRALDEIQKAGKKAIQLTHQMLAYGGRQPLRPRSVDPAATLQAMRSWLEQLAGFSIQLVLQADPVTSHRVSCDPTALEQVITLLATQSIARMQAAGGVLTLELTFPSDLMELTVRDTAEPLSAEMRAHIFEPFFSTKPRGKGAGMALAAAQGFAMQSGGSLRVAGSLQGNAFVLTLPLAASVDADLFEEIETTYAGDPFESTPVPALGRRPAVESSARTPASAPAEHTLQSRSATSAPTPAAAPRPDLSGVKMMLVEDEHTLRRLILQMLERRGAKPLEAEDGESALALARSLQAPIDVLLTDISMPGMDGFELYQRLKAEMPALRVVFMSGYTREAIEAETQLHPDFGFLTKPFMPALLYQAICAVAPSSLIPPLNPNPGSNV